MSALPLLLFGGGLLLLATGKKEPKPNPSIPSNVSQQIGTELARLPPETRDFMFRLMLTNDPANTADTYAAAILSLQQAGCPVTASYLSQIAAQRFGG